MLEKAKESADEKLDESEEEIQYSEIDQSDNDDKTVGTDPIVFRSGFVGKKAGQDPASIEGRNGDEVEDGKEDVDHHGGVEYHEQRFEGGAVLGQVFQGNENHQRNSRGRQVCGWPGKRNPEVIAAGMPEVAGIDHDRLGPAEGGRAEDEDEDQRKDDGPEWIDMGERVQRYTAHGGSRRVAHFHGRPSVRGFMNGDGEKQNENLNDNYSPIQGSPDIFYSTDRGIRKLLRRYPSAAEGPRGSSSFAAVI
jgi:hypothetical protein